MKLNIRKAWSSYSPTEQAVYIGIMIVAGISVISAAVLVVLAIVETSRERNLDRLRKQLANEDEQVVVTLHNGLRITAREFGPDRGIDVMALDNGVQADVVARSGDTRLLYAHGLVDNDIIENLQKNKDNTHDMELVEQTVRRAMQLPEEMHANVRFISVDHDSDVVPLFCRNDTCDASGRCGCVAHACIFLTELPNEESGGRIVVNENNALWAFRPRPGDALLWNRANGSLFAAVPTTQKYQPVHLIHVAFIRPQQDKIESLSPQDNVQIAQPHPPKHIETEIRTR